MKEQNEIRELFYGQGYNLSQIEELTGHTRKTISKYVSKEDWNNAAIIKCKREIKIDRYKSDIDAWLSEDKKMRKKQRHTATRVFVRLKEKYGDNFNCSYRTVANYVAVKKKELFKIEKGFIPLRHNYGEAQVDFGKAEFIESGIKYYGSYLVVSFPCSNAGFIQIFKGENSQCLLEGLKNIFSYIGGAPTKLWFDNMSTVVATIKKDGERELTKSFFRFKQHYGFGVTFCNPNAGNEKGNVECKVGYCRRNFLVPVPEFDSLEEYNKHLLTKCEEDHKRPHYMNETNISELFEADRNCFLALPEKEFETYIYESVKINGYGKFTLNAGLHTYSTSPKYANEVILVKISANEVAPLDENFNAIVAHKRLYGSAKQEKMDWLPYLSQLSKKPKAIKYSGVYDLFPENVRDIFNDENQKHHSGILKMMAKITERSSFETGIKVFESAMRHNKYDTESLLAIYNRILNPFIEFPEIKLPDHAPKLTDNNIDLELYDKAFLNKGGVICQKA